MAYDYYISLFGGDFYEELYEVKLISA